MPLVLDFKLNDYSRDACKLTETQKVALFWEWNIDMAVQLQAFSAPINKLIIYITMNKHIALIYTLSRSKHQNTANLSLQTYEKNQWICFTVQHGFDYNSRTNFANLGSFAKLSIPVEPAIPWLTKFIPRSRFLSHF